MGVFGADTREDVVRDRKGEARIWESPTTVGGRGGYFVLELVGLLFEGVPIACLAWFCEKSDTCGVADASVLRSDDTASERPVFPPNSLELGRCVAPRSPPRLTLDEDIGSTELCGGAFGCRSISGVRLFGGLDSGLPRWALCGSEVGSSRWMSGSFGAVVRFPPLSEVRVSAARLASRSIPPFP